MNINAEVATLYPSRSNMKKIPNITNINVYTVYALEPIF